MPVYNHKKIHQIGSLKPAKDDPKRSSGFKKAQEPLFKIKVKGKTVVDGIKKKKFVSKSYFRIKPQNKVYSKNYQQVQERIMQERIRYRKEWEKRQMEK